MLEPVSGDGTGDLYWKAACPLAFRASAPDILISLIAGYESCVYKCSSTLLDLPLFLAYTATLDITASTVDYLFCKHLYVKWKVVVSLSSWKTSSVLLILGLATDSCLILGIVYQFGESGSHCSTLSLKTQVLIFSIFSPTGYHICFVSSPWNVLSCLCLVTVDIQQLREPVMDAPKYRPATAFVLPPLRFAFFDLCGLCLRPGVSKY